MTWSQYLLVLLSEECAEVSHRVAKALRFGLDETEREGERDKSPLLRDSNLLAVVEMMEEKGLFANRSAGELLRDRKKSRILEHADLSRNLGLLDWNWE